ncbi:MAG: LysM domain protein [Thermoleophilia bacterium]|nr:LysM domain protein [Thermoleophilia bacterium]MCZ4495723.1 LysM domain protein [Thermoleophilia bacterium]
MGTTVNSSAATPALNTMPATQQGQQPSWLDSAQQLIGDTSGSVMGGGAPDVGAPPQKHRELPPFVQQYLPGGVKSTVPQDTWAGCCAIGQRPQEIDSYPTCTGFEPPEEAPGKWTPPTKGEPPVQGPPSKGEPPIQGPPSKGEPPTKGEPPVKGEAPGKADPVQSGSGTGVTYKVRPGDYLSKIAPPHGVTWKQLFWENRDQVKHPDLIFAGQVLRIPSPDLEVPDFEYDAMFTGPSVDTSPVVPDAPAKSATPPGKDAPPKDSGPKDTGPKDAGPKDAAPTPAQPPSAPPAAPPSTGRQSPPPVPNTGDLPPALPGS